MSRPRKPTAELERKGAFKRNPQRRAERGNEPIPTGPLGEPPNILKKLHKQAWDELAALVPPGVLTNSDRWLVEIASGLMARLRNPSPLSGGLNTGELAQLISCLGRMGLTPADRSKVGVPERRDENPFSEFATVGETARPN